jgi:MFS family permease
LQLDLIFSALVGSLTIGATFALSPVAGILTDRYGLRQTTLMGGTLAVIGMLLSSFLTHKVTALFISLYQQTHTFIACIHSDEGLRQF